MPKPLTILCVGDVFGEPGRRAVQVLLPKLRKQHDVDLAIVNVENSAGGFGVTPQMARVFMLPIDCPFRKADEILPELRKDTPVIIVDMHAEATSESQAMGWHLDGRVSAVVGTHRHVQTADERVLPQGTAYITDLGMTGPTDSVIGVDKDIALERFISQMPNRFEPAKGPVALHGALIKVDAETGRGLSIERLRVPLSD